MKNRMNIRPFFFAMVLGLGGALALASTSTAADAPVTWAKNCLSCHGKDGKGKTKAGRKAKVKDLTDADYQATFTDEQAFKSIKEGLTIDGKEKMKPYGDKLKDDEIKELVAFVRTLK